MKLEQYQFAIENSNIISKTDINGIITFVNEEFCKISGYTQKELVGQQYCKTPRCSCFNISRIVAYDFGKTDIQIHG